MDFRNVAAPTEIYIRVENNFPRPTATDSNVNIQQQM